MPIRRISILIVLLALLSGCESKPSAPVFDNPFDPAGTNGGDPFGLSATMGSSGITLIWNQISGYDISSYEVMHSNSPFDGFLSIGTVEASALEQASFTYENPEPTAHHYFKIQAFNSRGEFTLISHLEPVSVLTPARVVVNDGGLKVASRNITLSITVSEGDSLRISQEGRSGETVIPVTTPGAPDVINWDLGTVDSNDTTLALNVAVQNGANVAAPNRVELDVDFTPTLELSGGGNMIASRAPHFLIDTDGLVFMRFATAAEDLDQQNWLPGNASYSGLLLPDVSSSQTIQAEFLGDFGFSVITELTVTPDPLTSASFSLALPPNHITDQSLVRGLCSAVATTMRFSESLDFNAVPWQAYADTVLIPLSLEPGEKTIYAQFHNDFFDSPILTDFAIYLTQPLEITFLAPTEGSLLQGGTSLQVRGSALAPTSGAALDSVRFDGGQGFVPVDGLDDWSLLWPIPHFDEDTNLVLRARAWAGADSVTTLLNVVVSQLALAIVSPQPEAEIPGDTDVVVSGFTNPYQNGAAVDSVTVTIDDQTSAAEGTENWSYTWHPDAVAAPLDKSITATVFAGPDQYSRTVTVTVVPR